MFVRRAATISVLAYIYGADLAWSLPTEVARGVPGPSAEVPCDSITTYTTQFFEDNFAYAPTKDSCLFYTRGLSEAVQLLSEGPIVDGDGYTTIWDLFPCDLYKPDIVPYDPSKDLENPRRCIFAPGPKNNNGVPSQSADELTYFENMSRAMALWCDGTATVMNEDGTHLAGGVWGRVEFPTLKMIGNPGGTVNVVNKVDSNLENKSVFWKRPGVGTNIVAELGNQTSTITKRTPPRGKPQVRCLSPAQVAAIDITPW